jgi:PAS domain S-box-containing protein
MASAGASATGEAEAALADGQQLFRLLAEQAPIGIYLTDARGDCTYVNARWSEMAGLTSEEALGQGWLQGLHPDDRATIGDRWHRCVLGAGIWGFEYRFRNREGADTWVYGTASALHDSQGETIGYIGANVDISERRRAEATLRQSEATRAIAEEVAHVGSWTFSFASQRAVWSPEMCRLFGVSPDAFDGDFAPILASRVHADDRAAVEEATAVVIATGRPVPVEYRITLPDGTERIVHGDGKIELDDSGAPIGITGYYQDVTEQRRAEAEIRRLNAELEERVVTRTAELTAVTKELEAFAYSTSHDLRAPLRAIDGFSLMVLEDAAAVLAPDDVRHLERVREAAQRMGRLIDDLLGLSRMAQRPLDRERVDVSALAREVSDELLAEHQDRVMDVVIAPDMVANADPHLLRVILRNTLENAWKFTAKRAKARIEVGVIDADPERAFFVRDDGAGFDMRYADHLFGAFQRMHRAEEYPGDGIGLAMVQRLVNRHGGTAWAESQIEQGSTIFFTLPAPTNG